MHAVNLQCQTGPAPWCALAPTCCRKPASVGVVQECSAGAGVHVPAAHPRAGCGHSASFNAGTLLSRQPSASGTANTLSNLDCGPTSLR